MVESSSSKGGILFIQNRICPTKGLGSQVKTIFFQQSVYLDRLSQLCECQT
jgi:hypothetical protein